MVFTLFEAEDPRLIAQFNLAWNDILDMNLILLLDVEKDVLGLLKA